MPGLYGNRAGMMAPAMPGDEKGCFITTAVTRMNGEPDDGPTLTRLREFRDGYMMEDPARQQLVKSYYEIAPKIMQAIPEDSPTWGRLSAGIAKISDRIERGDNEGAMEGYSLMMDRLSRAYLKGTGNEGPEPAYENGNGGSDMSPHESRGMIEMYGNEGGSRIPALDQIRAMSGPKPNGLAYRYDRRKGRVEGVGRM